MKWGNTARNFAILMGVGFSILGLDAYFIANGQETFSETVWFINEKSLGIALLFGVLIGHFFTVPKKDK